MCVSLMLEEAWENGEAGSYRGSPDRSFNTEDPKRVYNNVFFEDMLPISR